MTTDEEVTKKVDTLWLDPGDREKVRAELDAYGRENYEREVPRVRMAVLKLCEGLVDRVPWLVTVAKQDYRDVLMWAEYPEEGQALWALRPDLTDEERARLVELRKRDREQYTKWRRE